MPKRLINFRGTKDFAYVKTKPTKPKSTTGIGGPLWASCNPSPFEQSVQAPLHVQFLSYEGGFMAGVKQGFAPTTSSFMAVAPVKPFKPMVFSNSKPPCPKKDPLSFEEPTFDEFKKLYPQYYGAK